MSIIIRKVRKRVREIEKGNLKLLFTKNCILDQRIVDGNVTDIYVTEVCNFSEIYDCSNINPESQNILQKIANELRLKLAAMHLDNEADNGQPMQ